MDAISSRDVFVALLRQKLAERAARKRDKTTENQTSANAAPEQSATDLSALTAKSGAADRELRRVIIEQLLSSRFDGQLVNEPRFQQILDQVSEQIAADPELCVMMDAVMRDIRSAP